MKTNKKKNRKVYDLVIVTMFIAVILVLAFTPIGLIDLPLIKATILHVPVIIGSLVLGPKKGALLGFVFGLTSLIKNTVTPSVLSFAFSPFIPVLGTDKGSIWALLICFLPRILVGVIPWLFVYAVEKLLKKNNLKIKTGMSVFAAVLGSFTNTLLVMGLIFLIFRQEYAAVNNIPVDAVLGVILGVIGANGVPEAICAGVLVPPVYYALGRFIKKETVTKSGKK